MLRNDWLSPQAESMLEGFYQYPEPIPGIQCAACGCAPTLLPDDTEFYRDRNGMRWWYCDDCFGWIIEGFTPMTKEESRDNPASPLHDFDLQWWAIHLAEFNNDRKYMRNPLRV